MRLCVAAAPVVFAAAFAGCGGSSAAPSQPPAGRTPRPARTCRSGVESRLGSGRVVDAAVGPTRLRALRCRGGPGAIGIAASSNDLTGWTQGGPGAIHGTNEPWSIGRSVSNGCIRLPNAVLRRLFRAVPAGTPVVIHA